MFFLILLFTALFGFSTESKISLVNNCIVKELLKETAFDAARSACASKFKVNLEANIKATTKNSTTYNIKIKNQSLSATVGIGNLICDECKDNMSKETKVQLNAKQMLIKSRIAVYRQFEKLNPSTCFSSDEKLESELSNIPTDHIHYYYPKEFGDGFVRMKNGECKKMCDDDEVLVRADIDSAGKIDVYDCASCAEMVNKLHRKIDKRSAEKYKSSATTNTCRDSEGCQSNEDLVIVKGEKKCLYQCSIYQKRNILGDCENQEKHCEKQFEYFSNVDWSDAAEIIKKPLGECDQAQLLKLVTEFQVKYIEGVRREKDRCEKAKPEIINFEVLMLPNIESHISLACAPKYSTEDYNKFVEDLSKYGIPRFYNRLPH